MWFTGAHSDTGGGYQEQGLANTALRWMTDEARAAGLSFEDADLDGYLRAPSEARLHDSMQPRAIYTAVNARDRLRVRLDDLRHPGRHTDVFLPDGRRNLEPTPSPPGPDGRAMTVPVSMASTAAEDYAHGYRPENMAAYLSRHPDPADPVAYEPTHRLPDGSAPPTPAAVRRRRR